MKRLLTLLTLLTLLALASMAEAQTHTFTLNWVFGAVLPDKSNAPTGVKVERKLGTSGTFAQVAQLGVVQTYQDALANPAPGGVQYCYRIRAFNATGDSPYTNEACGTTAVVIVPAPPNTPSGFTVSAISSSTIELSWAIGAAADNYKWERRRGNQPGKVEYTNTLLAGVTTVRDELLKRGTTYCYDVIAYTMYGDSAPTPILCATTRK